MMTKRLRIRLHYISESDSASSRTRLPVAILDADGAVLGGITAEESNFQYFEVPEAVEDPILLKVRLPSGEEQVTRVDFNGRQDVDVELLTDYVSPNEWLSWSRLQVRLGGLSMLEFESPNQVGSDIWVSLWFRTQERWKPVRAVPLDPHEAPYATQFDLVLEPGNYLLQVGGTRFPWRFISIPGGDRVRILLSPNTSKDPRSEPLRVTWSRLKPDEESLLSYLAQDRVRQAVTLAHEPSIAERMLFGKYDDPISACVGGYFLLKVGQVERLHGWPKNLYHHYPWLADGAVIHATELLHKANPDLPEVAAILNEAMSRGLPIFADGLRLLHEATQLLSATPAGDGITAVRTLIEQYVIAQSWNSFALSFYGVTPDAPNPDKVVGSPESPRLRMLRKTVIRTSNIRPEELRLIGEQKLVASGLGNMQYPASVVQAVPRWRYPPANEVSSDDELVSAARRIR